MSDRLDRYRAKRDFDATPEPGADAPGDEARRERFVVHEHHARRLHWDLRLERDGVLVSWAVPKGIPADPSRNHLAVHTEDHPLEYIDFHGDIPAGQYGAGTMKIWDRGTSETHKFRDKEVMITFHGERLHGRYVLFRTRGDDWMIHRMDPPEDPEREPMPERLQPMLARTGTLPRDKREWAYEIKWDGVRAIGYVDGGRLRVASRKGKTIPPRDPELRGGGRGAAVVEPQRERHHAAVPGSARARAGVGLARRDPRRRGGRVRRRPPLVPEAPKPHAPHLGARGAAAVAVRPCRLHDLRPAVARRALADGADLRG